MTRNIEIDLGYAFTMVGKNDYSMNGSEKALASFGIQDSTKISDIKKCIYTNEFFKGLAYLCVFNSQENKMVIIGQAENTGLSTSLNRVDLRLANGQSNVYSKEGNAPATVGKFNVNDIVLKNDDDIVPQYTIDHDKEVTFSDLSCVDYEQIVFNDKIKGNEFRQANEKGESKKVLGQYTLNLSELFASADSYSRSYMEKVKGQTKVSKQAIRAGTYQGMGS